MGFCAPLCAERIPSANRIEMEQERAANKLAWAKALKNIQMIRGTRMTTVQELKQALIKYFVFVASSSGVEQNFSRQQRHVTLQRKRLLPANEEALPKIFSICQVNLRKKQTILSGLLGWLGLTSMVLPKMDVLVALTKGSKENEDIRRRSSEASVKQDSSLCGGKQLFRLQDTAEMESMIKQWVSRPGPKLTPRRKNFWKERSKPGKYKPWQKILWHFTPKTCQSFRRV